MQYMNLNFSDRQCRPPLHLKHEPFHVQGRLMICRDHVDPTYELSMQICMIWFDQSDYSTYVFQLQKVGINFNNTRLGLK